MGLVYAEIELISGDDLVLHRRGYIKEDRIKRVLIDSKQQRLVVNPENPYISKKYVK